MTPQNAEIPKNIPYHDVFMGTLPSRRGKCVTLFGGITNIVHLLFASSGLAATLVDCGRTENSALKLPLNMQVIETPTCNISKYSGTGKVLRSCQLIIWDEYTMAHKNHWKHSIA
ncbi:ATP-dependent DNA helicase [Trichonephila clavipes]|nr:ATP-dependent DNA helicase [Trichonephila clavipes]